MRSATGVQLKLAEANPLTGALKFEPLDSEGKPIEPRGSKPPPRSD